jgi:hypothetical protein
MRCSRAASVTGLERLHASLFWSNTCFELRSKRFCNA